MVNKMSLIHRCSLYKPGDYSSMVNEVVSTGKWDNSRSLGETWRGRNVYEYGRTKMAAGAAIGRTARPQVDAVPPAIRPRAHSNHLLESLRHPKSAFFSISRPAASHKVRGCWVSLKAAVVGSTVVDTKQDSPIDPPLPSVLDTCQ
jgi:hypothetical protein